MSTTVPEEKENEERIHKCANQIAAVLFDDLPPRLRPAVLKKVKEMMLNACSEQLTHARKECAELEVIHKELQEN
jgi:hypothetical protein